MMITLSLFTLAHADAAPCMNAYVGSTLPAPLATEVPVGVVPTAVLVDGGCGSSAWTMRLTLDGEEVGTADFPADNGFLLELDPGADLLPDTQYGLEIQPTDGGGELTTVGFTTGSGTAAELDGVPTVEGLAASVNEDGVGSVQGFIVPAGSADGSSIVALALADDAETNVYVQQASGTSRVSFYTGVTVGDIHDDVCVVAHERDLAGQWTTSGPVCVAPSVVRSSETGCLSNTAAGTPLGWMGVGLAVATLVRRRR